MKLSMLYPCTRYLASAGQVVPSTRIAGPRISSCFVSSSTTPPRTRAFSCLAGARTRTFGCLVSTTLQFLSPTVVSGTHHLKANMSLCRQNYPEECEAGVNRQINLELYASYVYTSMAYHFDRDDVALPGFYKYFKNLADEERIHAEKLMKYQNLRGGRIVLQDIKKPETDIWGSGLEAMMSALKLEKHVNQSLLDLHQIAESKNDVQFEDFMEDVYLKDQVESIKEISDFVTQLNRVGPGLGEYLFDKETLQELK